MRSVRLAHNHTKFVVTFFFTLFLIVPAVSHDPITTSVTFNKEIIRILQRNCLSCHAPGKIKSDIPLTSFELARPWAKAIKEEILEKRMPPFQAVKGYGDFHNGYLLPHRDVELIVSWVEGGAPRGEEKDIPKDLLAGTSWTVGKPDLNLQPETLIEIPAGEGEEIRCLTLPTNLKSEQWANAFEFIPTNASIIHSAEFFVTQNCADGCKTGEKIGEWNPGQTAIKIPEDTGILLPKNACITLKIRYRQAAAPAQDHSVFGVYFAYEDIFKKAQSIKIKPPPITIAAGATNQRVKATYILRENAEAVAIRPLLFPYAKSVAVTALRPDGTSEILIVTNDYRTAWQPSYYFKQPVPLPLGTRIEVTAYLDNSEDNRNLSDKLKPVRFNESLCELVLAKKIAGQ